MRTVALVILMVSCCVINGLAETPDDAVEFLNARIAEITAAAPAPQLAAGLPPPKCGTPVTVAAKLYQLIGENSALLEPMDRPIDLPQTFGASHILVHYTLTGLDAPYQVNVDNNPADGVPDYINRVLETFEYVWNYQISTMGYTSPPTDSGRGGDNRYDVYVENLGTGFFGFTNPEDVVDGYRANSFISIENDFAGSSYQNNPLDGLRVTAAHEFFHAVQFGYDALEFDFDDPNQPLTFRPWWLEASSTWMEDVIYDNVNDYLGYLPFFLGYSWMGLGTFSYNYGNARSYHPYGACLWPIFLTEKYNDLNIMRQIWQGCGQVAGYNALYVMESLLQNRSSTLNRAFQEFTVWNFHSGAFADTSVFYSEGAAFPEVDTAGHIANLDVLPQHITFQYNPPEFMGANYIFIDANFKPGGLRINFDGQDISGASWYVSLLGYWPFDSEWRDMGVGYNNGAGIEEWRDWDFFQTIVIIPTVSDLVPIHNQSFPYDGFVVYDPSLTGDPDLTGGTRVFEPYPSPFVIAPGGSSVTIPYSLQRRFSREDIYVRIYDASGGMVREFSHDAIPSTTPGYHQNGFTWDGKNDKNEYVASGVYILHMEAGEKSSHVKIAVVNGN